MSKNKIHNIRNFCIIAHIDHGKSTLADRLLERTNTIELRDMKEQHLDGMELERERGITIKMHPVRMDYETEGRDYILNLIDTPGHVDFTYEVSRSMAACEGAVLVVDASQGIEAQTLANSYMAIEAGLNIIPVVNKIDLKYAREKRVAREIAEFLGIDVEEVIFTSAKEGIGIDEVLKAIIERVPPPSGSEDNPLRALIFDSIYNSFLGAVAYIRIFDGEVRIGEEFSFYANNRSFEAMELGIFKPEMIERDVLRAGEVGYLATGVKSVRDVKVGDTVMSEGRPADEPLPGYKEIKPVVFCGLYPVDNDDYSLLRTALDKLSLNDASFIYEPETSQALGFGFRLGFLGLLHMEIIRERLEREFDMELITTPPNVEYKVERKDGELIYVDNPAEMPEYGDIETISERYVRMSIVSPSDYIGDVMKLCEDKFGDYIGMEYIDTDRVIIDYDLPLSNIVIDFYDKLKSLSRGLASLDYELLDFKEDNLVKLDILVNGDVVDAFSSVVHSDQAYRKGCALISKLKEVIPRQLFEVVLQASSEGRVISKGVIKPLRKNVTSKCYGGDVTRKRKLLKKQKEGKKRMKSVGKVEIPQEAFMSILSIEE